MNYSDYKQYLNKIANLNTAIAVLHWDKEVNLPSLGAGPRAQQIATLSGMAHELATSDEFGDQLRSLVEDSSLSEDEKKNVSLTLKDYKRSKKLDLEFVVALSNATSEGYHSWLKARKSNDFEDFRPSLEKLIKLKRQEAEKLGYEKHPYDALMEYYEPGATVEELNLLFKDVRSQLAPLTARIREKENVRNDFLFQHYPHQQQWDFGLELLKNMGYDFDRGRQDISPHPFTISFSPQDVRVTTHVDENNFASMTWSCIHEGGHALYEQGLLMDNFGLPLGQSTSLGIHESQSRLWENNVGRSKFYWSAHYPKVQQIFSKQLGNISLDQFYKGINRIEPSLIRIESDELHYHLHILIRYELERALMEGNLEVRDLKEAWNAKYKEYLDVEVPNDNKGVLQDIHWAHGSIGYFPTYSLGSFYAAQFFHQVKKEIPGLEEEIAQGNNQSLLDWLKDNIHQYGRKYTAKELCEKVCGEPLKLKYFMAYAEEKFGAIYDL
jgi:carboxypeptidase Taq